MVDGRKNGGQEMFRDVLIAKRGCEGDLRLALVEGLEALVAEREKDRRIRVRAAAVLSLLGGRRS